MIEARHIRFDYIRRDEKKEVIALETALKDVSFEVKAGDFVAILGHNGSGKSTLAKHINALLVPEEGTVYVEHMDTSEEDMKWKIRQRVGMVFQNPDNQIVHNVVEEDVGFGPENIGVPQRKYGSGSKTLWKKWGCSLRERNHRIICQAVRNRGWQLQEYWQCIRSVLCLTKPPPCSTR